jgi:TPP-dependent pyruvate/acetoin dehydrogenase alpha subunit
LIEAITYRLGYHTSSDNPDLYRQEAEAALWADWDPLRRMSIYLRGKGWWDDDDEAQLQEQCSRDIQDAIDDASARPLPPAGSQFEDVFEESNWLLDSQQSRLFSDYAEGTE